MGAGARALAIQPLEALKGGQTSRRFQEARSKSATMEVNLVAVSCGTFDGLVLPQLRRLGILKRPIHLVFPTTLDEAGGDRGETSGVLVSAAGGPIAREYAAGRGKMHTPHTMIDDLVFDPALHHSPAQIAMLTVSEVQGRSHLQAPLEASGGEPPGS